MVIIATSDSDSKLTLTHDHLVYVERDGKWEYIFSENVQPGMKIQVASEDSTFSVQIIQSVVR